jgi:NAD(P)H dehydrogenase (quinone)
VFAHPNPKSFCHAILQQFTGGLKDAGHSCEVVDLYAIRFDPVFRTADFASYVHESIPKEVLERMNLKKYILGSMRGPIQRFLASLWLRGNDNLTVLPNSSTNICLKTL